ncbi:hypothetical protein AV530_003962 [Patagioenas fasciata monilis]|uniref:Uncharacterized protein n=1 Tax=Patagioenas fasciata monilis TaxID=372326 RepID=A0A1V4JQI2_PATFA|nr:hypothetical protein AV530_003962 [Patagioenas fasciata monilis]
MQHCFEVLSEKTQARVLQAVWVIISHQVIRPRETSASGARATCNGCKSCFYFENICYFNITDESANMKDNI